MTDNHIHDNGKHVAQLDSRLKTLAAGFSDAGSSDDFDELFTIIHNPGFTTPVQLLLTHQLVEAAERNLAEAAQLRSALVQGARAILEESAVAV
jgi:hypothetical protein